MKKFIKILALSSSLVVSSTVASFTNVVNVAKNDDNVIDKVAQQELIDKVKADVLANKEYLGEHEYLDYNGQEFYSNNLLNEYLFNNKLIERHLTSSNPFKIFKNTNFVIDDKQVYDLNPDNFQQVYRTAWGDIAYSLEDALSTYVNDGNIHEQFSYNGFNWYSSRSDAERQAMRNTEVSNSLYYLQNSQYYNAFNTEDINALLSLMTNGLYVTRTNTLSGAKLNKDDIIYGAKDVVRAKLKTVLYDEWNTNAFLDKITKTELVNSIQITPRDSYYLKIVYRSDDNLGGTKNLPADETYNSGSTANVIFDNNLGSKDQILNWYQNRSFWTQKEEKFPVGHRYWLDRNFKVIKNGKTYNANFWLIPNSAETYFTSTVPNVATSYSNIASESANISFYYDSSKTSDKLMKTYKVSDKTHYKELDRVTMDSAFETWFDWYFETNINNFGSNANKRFNFDDLKANRYVISTVNPVDRIGSVFKDVSYEINYGKGFNESLINTYKNDWLPIKKQILEAPVLKNGKKYYQLNLTGLKTNLLLTEDELDNFLPLYGNIPVTEMYSYSDQENPQDRYGITLAKTKAEAQQKKILNEAKTLYTRFVYYDRFGNEIVNSNSREDAKISLKKQLKFSSKYIHKDEINSWSMKNEHAWESVIADGVYEIYSIQNAFNKDKRIYYISRDAALQALKTEVINSNGVYLTEIKSTYLYTYKTKDGLTKTVSFTLDNIDNIVNDIILDL